MCILRKQRITNIWLNIVIKIYLLLYLNVKQTCYILTGTVNDK